MNPTTPTPLVSFAQIYFLVFGLVTIMGGIMGYVKAGSQASLIAGGISGGLLLVGGYLLHRTGAPFTFGTILNLLISLALLGQFLPKLLQGKMNPAAYVVPLSGIGIITAALLLVGLYADHR